MKLWSYTFLMIGLVILLNLVGLTESNSLLNLIGYSRSGANISFSYQAFLTTIVVLISGAAATGAAASFFGRTINVKILVVSIISGGTLGLFLQSFYLFFTQAGSAAPWIKAVIVLIVAPLIIGYIITIMDWFGGTD